MSSIGRQVLLSLVLAAMAAAIGCEGSSQPDPELSGRIGENCTVFFCHDALGMAAGAPASPTTGNHNGADLALTGKLLKANGGWIAIAAGKAEYTIPKEAILVVEVASK
jgi:hypothetical protein